MANQSNSNKVTTVLGRKGSGKSTALAWLVRERKDETGKPALIVDWLGDAIHLFDTEEVAIEEIRGRIAAGDDIVIYEPGRDEKEVLTDIGNEIGIGIVPRDPLEEFIFVIDELDFVRSTTSVIVDLAVSRIIRFGRHYGIDLYVAARRPQDLPKLLLSQSDVIACGTLATPKDRKALEEYGFQAEQLEQLSIGQFAVRTSSTGDVTVETFPKIW